MFKIALFLVVAVVAVQGVQPSSGKSTRIKLNDVIDAIKTVIAKIKDIVGIVQSSLGEVLKNLEDKIKQVVYNIEEAIREFKLKVEEFIRKYGEPARKCYVQLKPEIEEIVQATRQGIIGCARQAGNKLAVAKKDVAALIKKVYDFQNDVNERVMKCAQQSEWNIPEMKKCLEAQAESIHEEFVQLQNEVDAIIESTTELVAEAKADLDKCLNEVKEDINERQQHFADNFYKCLTANQ